MPTGTGPSSQSIRVTVLPQDWEHRVSSAACLLDGLGPAFLFWGSGALLLLGALVLTRRRPNVAIALAACASFCLGVGVNGIVDDSYIQFRYAANLAAGLGPVFNPGERIEGASGGLWIAILGGLGALTGWDVASLGRFLSLLFAPLVTLAAAMAGAAFGGAEAGALAAVLWALVPTGALFAATGLETTAFALALFLFAAGARNRPALAMVAGAAIATLRPEGVILGAAALPLLPRMSRAARLGVGALLGAASLIAAARFAYYGLPFPRSALVKGITAAGGPFHGLSYLGSGVIEWLPLLGAFHVLAKERARLLPALAPVALWTAMVVARGGDWMPGSRYLLPLVALLVVSLASAPRLARPLAAAALLWTAVQIVPAAAPSPSPAGALYRKMNLLRVQARWWESVGTWIARTVPPETKFASGPSGALAYASRLRFFDMYGLSSKVSRPREGLPGHRLWGLPDAVAWGADIVYVGDDLPQGARWDVVMAIAAHQVRNVPGFTRDYRPNGIAHRAEYRPIDILTDVIWVRKGAAIGLGPEGR